MGIPDPATKVVFYTAWWWPIYAAALTTVCQLCHTRPDEQKLEAMIYRALRVRKADPGDDYERIESARKRNGG